MYSVTFMTRLKKLLHVVSFCGSTRIFNCLSSSQRPLKYLIKDYIKYIKAANSQQETDVGRL